LLLTLTGATGRRKVCVTKRRKRGKGFATPYEVQQDRSTSKAKPDAAGKHTVWTWPSNAWGIPQVRPSAALTVVQAGTADTTAGV
jgi:hypothetical protein